MTFIFLALAKGLILFIMMGCSAEQDARLREPAQIGDSYNEIDQNSVNVAKPSTMADEADKFQSLPITPSATHTPKIISTTTPVATSSAEPSLTATTSPSLTPSPTQTSSPTPALNLTATALSEKDTVDRTCPEPLPGKPDYNHYYLSSDRWVMPDPTLGEHFWLEKPLPGGGRLLYTDWLPYGYDAGGRYLLHNGVDMAEPLGTPVLSAAVGQVVYAGKDDQLLYGWRCDWYGELVAIRIDQQWQGQPVYLLYGHVLNTTVETGERVTRGQQIAEVGYGGAAKLPHLHFEVRVGSNEFNGTRNPLLWIQPPETRGIIVGRLIDPEGRPWQGVTIAAVGRSAGTETIRTWSYLGDPQGIINGDEFFGENFVFGDLKPGEYELYIDLQGTVYREMVTVVGGQVQSVEIVTEPFRPPDDSVPTITPEVKVTPTPEA